MKYKVKLDIKKVNLKDAAKVGVYCCLGVAAIGIGSVISPIALGVTTGLTVAGAFSLGHRIGKRKSENKDSK